MIDLLKLNYLDKIEIDEEIEIPKEDYEKTDIISLSKILTKGYITLNENKEYNVQLELSGVMSLNDAITLECVPYKFNTVVEETLENSMKTLDLIEFLWHYIILEVPLRFTNSEISNIETENYRVISEEEYSKKNNPFSDFSLE